MIYIAVIIILLVLGIWVWYYISRERTIAELQRASDDQVAQVRKLNEQRIQQDQLLRDQEKARAAVATKEQAQEALKSAWTDDLPPRSKLPPKPGGG